MNFSATTRHTSRTRSQARTKVDRAHPERPGRTGCRHRGHRLPRHGRGRPRRGHHRGPRRRHHRSRAAVDPSSTGHAVDARHTRDAHSGAPSHSGSCGDCGAVEVVEWKLSATQTVREQRAREGQDVRRHASWCGQQAGRGRELAKAQQGEVLRRSEAGQTVRGGAATHRHGGLVRDEVVLVRLGLLRSAAARAPRPTRAERTVITLTDACRGAAG